MLWTEVDFDHLEFESLGVVDAPEETLSIKQSRNCVWL